MISEFFIEIIKYFTSVTVLTAGIVWLGKYIFDNAAKSSLEKYKNELKIEFENERIALQKEKESFDRKTAEIKKWTNPILSSVNGIMGRLNHIVNQKGYKELSPEHCNYDYYSSSTNYYFAQYLCWIQIFKEEINYEIFETDTKEKNFFKAIKDVNISIRKHEENLSQELRGSPIYSLQQREIAEMIRIENTKTCLGYYLFKKNFVDIGSKNILEPIERLSKNIQPGTKEFERVKDILEKLEVLQTECIKVLKGK